jgi:hypothetical protein
VVTLQLPDSALRESGVVRCGDMIKRSTHLFN